MLHVIEWEIPDFIMEFTGKEEGKWVNLQMWTEFGL